MKILKDIKAEGYIDVAVAVLVIAFSLVLTVSVFGAATKKQDLKYMCAELVEIATVSGRVGSEVDERYTQLYRETGFEPTMNFTAEYCDSDGKVQLGDTISCTLTSKISLKGFGGEIFSFDMTVTKSGLSQVYWK